MKDSSELFDKYYKEAEKYLQKMTIEERIGQMFFIEYSKNASKEILNKKVGGFLLYAKHFKKDESLIIEEIKSIQNLSMKTVNLPLGLAVDEEGGFVNRVSCSHRDKGEFPFAQEIYKNSGIQGILEIEQEKRNLLRKFHMNINLAPVADISYNEKDYIYPRTLGKLPDETSKYIAKEVEGYVKDNFTCCAKHFPGYGNNVDTHGEISIDKRSYEVFLNEDLKPFKAAIDKKIPLILFSHNIVECKDNKYPASISKIWHDILRKELNYSGLIITDNLSMGAIRKYSLNESVAVLAIKAGNDIILTNNSDMHLDEVKKAIQSGDISEDIINIACKRIIAWKLKYLLNYQPQD